jgi:molybdenum cofactor biosynthesis enzyme MoaA
MLCNPKNSCVNCETNGIDIKITNICNANCSFCIEKGGYSPKEKDVKDLIIATNTLNNYKNVLILGGEPLLYPHLEEYLKGISEKNIYLTTNGICLNEDIAAMLSKYLTAINISIHHYKEAKNAEIFDVQNYSFDNIIKAIKVFNRKNVPVRINCNLVKNILDNKDDITKMMHFAEFIGANAIRFSELQNCEDLYVDAQTIFKLNDNPYTQGCEQEIYNSNGFKATIKVTCGFVNRLKVLPVDPERKQTVRNVIYTNAEVRSGWESNTYSCHGASRQQSCY